MQKIFFHNALNQITGISGGGRLRFSGTMSEAAHVSVQGRAARMLDATTFTADAEVVPGVNTIPAVAQRTGMPQLGAWE